MKVLSILAKPTHYRPSSLSCRKKLSTQHSCPWPTSKPKPKLGTLANKKKKLHSAAQRSAAFFVLLKQAKENIRFKSYSGYKTDRYHRAC